MNSATEPPSTCAPIACRLLRTSGSLRTLLKAAFNFSVISFGACAGSITPYQALATMGTPDSFNVGTLGSSGIRLSEATASAFSFPPLMLFKEPVSNIISM